MTNTTLTAALEILMGHSSEIDSDCLSVSELRKLARGIIKSPSKMTKEELQHQLKETIAAIVNLTVTDDKGTQMAPLMGDDKKKARAAYPQNIIQVDVCKPLRVFKGRRYQIEDTVFIYDGADLTFIRKDIEESYPVCKPSELKQIVESYFDGRFQFPAPPPRKARAPRTASPEAATPAPTEVVSPAPVKAPTEVVSPAPVKDNGILEQVQKARLLFSKAPKDDEADSFSRLKIKAKLEGAGVDTEGMSMQHMMVVLNNLPQKVYPMKEAAIEAPTISVPDSKGVQTLTQVLTHFEQTQKTRRESPLVGYITQVREKVSRPISLTLDDDATHVTLTFMGNRFTFDIPETTAVCELVSNLVAYINYGGFGGPKAGFDILQAGFGPVGVVESPATEVPPTVTEVPPTVTEVPPTAPTLDPISQEEYSELSEILGGPDAYFELDFGSITATVDFKASLNDETVSSVRVCSGGKCEIAANPSVDNLISMLTILESGYKADKA